MTAIRIHVTAEHIAAAGPPPGEDAVLETVARDPVEHAIAEATGQDVMCDQDDDTEMATIGRGSTVLVVNLPRAQYEWINAWYAGVPVEPFTFDIEIEDWLTALLRNAEIPA